MSSSLHASSHRNKIIRGPAAAAASEPSETDYRAKLETADYWLRDIPLVANMSFHWHYTPFVLSNLQ